MPHGQHHKATRRDIVPSVALCCFGVASLTGAEKRPKPNTIQHTKKGICRHRGKASAGTGAKHLPAQGQSICRHRGKDQESRASGGAAQGQDETGHFQAF